MTAANFMDAKTFNQNYEVDRKSKGVRANSKHAPAAPVQIILTADGAAYEAGKTYHFFDVQTQEVRQSPGLRRDGEFLCTFGLKVVRIEKIRANRDDALADGQNFFNAEIERLRQRVRKYEAEKTPSARSLKAVLMSR